MEETDFAYALRALADGELVTRAGWNAKHVLVRSSGGEATVRTGAVREAENTVYLEGFIVILANVEVTDGPRGLRVNRWAEARPWLASQADMLATDWAVVR